MPKVSIVCSVYNAGTFFEPFIKSVLQQTFSDYEAVFVDANSTDGTRELLEKYQQIDRRIIIIKENHISIASALNIGLNKASGEYIARIDADNILFPSFLNDYVVFLDSNKEVDFVISDQLKIDEKNKVLGLNPFVITDYALKKNLLFKTAIGGAPMMGKRQAFFDVGLYQEDTIITEDRIFALKAMQDKIFASINKVNYAYRIHSGAITRRYKKNADHHKKVQHYENMFIKENYYYNDIAQFKSIGEKPLFFKKLILKKIANTIMYCGFVLADKRKINPALGQLAIAKTIFPENSLVYTFFEILIRLGVKNLLKKAAGFNHWVPYTIDFLQFVPLKIWKKNAASPEDTQALKTILADYQTLLEHVT